MSKTEQDYLRAKEIYADFNVNTDDVLKNMENVQLSLHCWQTDDGGGLESPDSVLSGGGIQVTGNHPGKARNAGEIRSDLEKAYSLLPGNHRLNLHAIYGDFNGRKIDRNQVEPEHFAEWIQWCSDRNVEMDFNSTYYSHPKADSGYTLSNRDKGIRDFWIDHGKRCRKISDYIGQNQKTPCIHNTWIPDGAKDLPVDRIGYRERLSESLDEIFQTAYSDDNMKDAVETKLFGIGSESFVVGSHEFYMGYAATRKKMVTLDMGHFHPTELIADKLSSLYLFFDEVLLHVSRPVRWDSDHVVIVNDDLIALCQELVRCRQLKRTHIGLDFFDGSINRIGAYAIGARSTLKGMMQAFLEPGDLLLKADADNNAFERLALLEETKSLPFGAVWNYYCEQQNVLSDREMVKDILKYEQDVLLKRS